MVVVESPNAQARSARDLTVHFTHRPPAPVLRYVDEVVGESNPGLTFRYSQGVLTSFDVDVVHVVDSSLDTLIGTADASSRQRLLATWAFVRNLRKHRIALVRTVDGTDQRDQRSRSDRIASELLDRVTSAFIVRDAFTQTPAPARTHLIPYSEFGERFVGYPGATQVPGRLLCIARGFLPSSAVGLLQLIRVTNTPGLTIRFVAPAHRLSATKLKGAEARRSKLISTRLERISDGARIQEIDAAELVVLPRAPHTPHDLQILFLALSRRRPVLTPRTEALAELSDEIGVGWLHLTDGPITAEAIDLAIDFGRATERSGAPNLEGRSLASTRAAFAQVFERAAATKSVRARSRSRS